MVEGLLEQGEAALVLQHPFVWSGGQAEEEQGVQAAEPVVTVDGVFGRGEFVHRRFAHDCLRGGGRGGMRRAHRHNSDEGEQGDDGCGESQRYGERAFSHHEPPASVVPKVGVEPTRTSLPNGF